MPIDIGAAKLLLDTFANVSGNARTRARDRIIELLTEVKPEGWQEEREAMQRTINRQREADERSLTMLAECRKALVDMTAQRDLATAKSRKQS